MLSSTADRVQEALPSRMREVFDGDGMRDGEGYRWQPTSAVALRNRQNPVDPASNDWMTLVDTGAMRDSIAPFGRTDKPDRVELLVGATVPYAPDMQEGTEYHGRPVPARPFQFATEADADMVEAEIDSALRSVMEAR